MNDLNKLREEDRKEIAELRQNQLEVMSKTGSSEILNMFDTIQVKHEDLKQEYDNMR